MCKVPDFDEPFGGFEFADSHPPGTVINWCPICGLLIVSYYDVVPGWEEAAWEETEQCSNCKGTIMWVHIPEGV